MSSRLRLETEVLDLRTRHPFIIARGNTSDYRTVMVRLIDQDGVEGWGEAAPTAYYGETTETVLAALKGYAEVLPADPAHLQQAEEAFELRIHRNPAARAALSAALHDLAGKRQGIPVYQMWGLDPAKAPMSTFTIGIDTPERIRMKVKEAEQYPILKIKLGSDRDLEILKAIRDTTTKEIRVDANCGWTVKHAISMLPVLEEFGVTVLEQPLMPRNYDGLAQIRRAARIPLIADEDCEVAADIPLLLGSVDGINIKLAKCGSLREALRMIAIARSHHLMVMVGCMIESSLAITAAAHFTPLVDIVDLDGAALLSKDPMVGATIAGGQVTLPHRAGSGRYAAMSQEFGQVALPLPLAQPYTYRIPEAIADRAVPGSRVVVPVRQREMVGILLGYGEAPDGVQVKSILGAPDAEPALSHSLLETAQWIAGYYSAPLGLTLKAMLPGALWGESSVVAEVRSDPERTTGGLGGDILIWLARKGGKAPVASIARALKKPVWDAVNRLNRVGALSLSVVPADTTAMAASQRIVVLERTPSLLEREALFKRAKEQGRLYDAIEELGGRSPVPHLREQLGFSAAVIKALVTRGLARIELESRLRDPFADLAGSPPPTDLTAGQRAALAVIEALPPGDSALLFGVTGSGKTLVYLEAIRAELQRGKGAILLVPEISLTPQTVNRVRGAFGDAVAVLHSALSDSERADAWRSLRSGEKRVAVGARSAIFAPVASLGVIIIDEEHESSYKNGETPRYHARDVAQVRARIEQARLVLGSATPSPETFARVGNRMPMIELPERIGGRPMPAVEVVDLRSAPLVAEARPVPWSVALDEAVGATLARQEQSLLLLNRRGYASFIQCPACGTVAQCDQCSISLTVHQAPPALRCHYCNSNYPLARACGHCGHAVQQMRGLGTQQLERLLAERFPTARISRMDLDTTSTKWSHHEILERVGRGEVDILLGTQMIAKGLDFPNVTLVGVVDADTGLYLPDFRSAERTFQLLAQVAGRAGRGPKGGRVIVQTYRPEHHAVRHAAAHDTVAFTKEEIALRQSPPYPPTLSLANLLVSGPNENAVSTAAAETADWCRGLIEKYELPIAVLGPAPSPIARIKNRWRWHVVLRGPSDAIGRVTRYAAGRITSGGEPRIVVDRDPGSML